MTGEGPIPLAQAREMLRGVRAFSKDDGDRLWDALLSLADAAELVEVASRLRWEFHPRGFDNTDLHARYGDGIVPWREIVAAATRQNVEWYIVEEDNPKDAIAEITRGRMFLRGLDETVVPG